VLSQDAQDAQDAAAGEVGHGALVGRPGGDGVLGAGHVPRIPERSDRAPPGFPLREEVAGPGWETVGSRRPMWPGGCAP
jgi:hypothetical protein